MNHYVCTSISHCNGISPYLDIFFRTFEVRLRHNHLKSRHNRTSHHSKQVISSLTSLMMCSPTNWRHICQWHLEKFELVRLAYGKNVGPDIPRLKDIFSQCTSCVQLIEKLDMDYKCRRKRNRGNRNANGKIPQSTSISPNPPISPHSDAIFSTEESDGCLGDFKSSLDYDSSILESAISNRGQDVENGSQFPSSSPNSLIFSGPEESISSTDESYFNLPMDTFAADLSILDNPLWDMQSKEDFFGDFNNLLDCNMLMRNVSFEAEDLVRSSSFADFWRS